MWGKMNSLLHIINKAEKDGKNNQRCIYCFSHFKLTEIKASEVTTTQVVEGNYTRNGAQLSSSPSELPT